MQMVFCANELLQNETLPNKINVVRIVNYHHDEHYIRHEIQKAMKLTLNLHSAAASQNHVSKIHSQINYFVMLHIMLVWVEIENIPLTHYRSTSMQTMMDGNSGSCAFVFVWVLELFLQHVFFVCTMI